MSARAERLRQRFETSGERADLDEAVRLGREAVRRAEASPAAVHGLAAFRLGTTLSLVFEHDGSVRDADEALTQFDTAGRLLPAGHQDLPAVSANRAAVLIQRFVRSGAPNELDAAITAAQHSISLSADDDPRNAVRYSNLGGLLRTRFLMTGAFSDIDAAIEQGRLAVRRLSPEARQPAAFHAALAASLALRFSLTQTDEDLAETIEVARRAVVLAPVAGREHLMALGVLAAALQMDFERTGNPTPQSEAIECLRETTDLLPRGHTDLPANLGNLATALLKRQERFGAREDVDEAIAAARRALDEGHAVTEPLLRGILASALLRLGSRLSADGDTIAAVRACDEALDEAARALDRLPPGHPDLGDVHTLAGNAWISRFQAGGNPADARKAGEAYRAAVASIALDDPRRGLMLTNLGAFYLLCDPDEQHAGQNLTDATGALRQAVLLSPPGHPVWAQAVANLAVALLKAEQASGGTTTSGRPERDEALALFAELDDVASAPPRLRLIANQMTALVCGAEGDTATACARYAAAVELLPQTAWHGLGQAVKERELADRTGLGSDAAAVHIDAGAPDRALELLEQSRGVLWSQRLARRFVDVQLETALPDHAKRLRELTQALDAVG